MRLRRSIITQKQKHNTWHINPKKTLVTFSWFDPELLLCELLLRIFTPSLPSKLRQIFALKARCRRNRQFWVPHLGIKAATNAGCAFSNLAQVRQLGLRMVPFWSRWLCNCRRRRSSEGLRCRNDECIGNHCTAREQNPSRCMPIYRPQLTYHTISAISVVNRPVQYTCRV